MRRLSLSSGSFLIALLTSGMALAQSSGSARCHSNGNILISGDNLAPPAAAASGGSWVPMQPVQKVHLEIAAVDTNQNVMVLHNSAEDKDYPVKIDKSVKLSADKKIMKRKPEISDFSKGDAVKVTVNLFQGRVLEVRLIKNGNFQAAK
jgi:hypothetical protein